MPMSSPQITRMLGLSLRCFSLVAIPTSLAQVLSTLRGRARGRAGPFDPVFAADGPFGSIRACDRPPHGVCDKSPNCCPRTSHALLPRSLLCDVMRSRGSGRHRTLLGVIAFGVLWCLGADSPAACARDRVAD